MFETALTAVLDAGHRARFVAGGDSMHPTIRDGDAVHIERCTTPLAAGDIVLARTWRGLTAHRIVRLRQRNGMTEIITRGDNCLRNDRPFTPDALLGRVVSVERNGAQMHLFDKQITRFSVPKSTFMRWTTIVRRFRQWHS